MTTIRCRKCGNEILGEEFELDSEFDTHKYYEHCKSCFNKLLEDRKNLKIGDTVTVRLGNKYGPPSDITFRLSHLLIYDCGNDGIIYERVGHYCVRCGTPEYHDLWDVIDIKHESS